MVLVSFSMCFIVKPRFFRHVVNPTSTTYQQGILAIEHLFHTSDTAGYMEAGEPVDIQAFAISFVKGSRLHWITHFGACQNWIVHTYCNERIFLRKTHRGSDNRLLRSYIRLCQNHFSLFYFSKNYIYTVRPLFSETWAEVFDKRVISLFLTRRCMTPWTPVGHFGSADLIGRTFVLKNRVQQASFHSFHCSAVFKVS